MYLPTTVKNPFASIELERRVSANKKEYYFDKLWEFLLYLACMFPFTMWIPYYFVPALYTASDTQPYALVFSAVILLIYIWKNPHLDKATMVCVFWGIGVIVFALLAIPDMGVGAALKKYSTYVSGVSIPIAVFLILKKNQGLNEGLLKLGIWIWFIVGFIQKNWIPNFGHYMVIRQVTNVSRGVVSCATEPTTYGCVCFFLILIALHFKKSRAFYVGFLLLQIFALAGSTISLLYVGVYIVGIALNEIIQRKKFALLKAVGLVGGGIWALYLGNKYNLLPARMKYLVGFAFQGNWVRVFGDGSVKLRIMGITDSVGSFLEHHGMPQGFNVVRLNSGIGILLMECGFFTIIFLAAVAVIIYKAYPKRIRFIFVFGFMCVMFSTVTFSNPIVGFYLGTCMYYGWLNEKKEAEVEGTLDL
ncbi:MAG: hypothetical protein ACI4F0_09945 [Agathobacter sp.]